MGEGWPEVEDCSLLLCREEGVGGRDRRAERGPDLQW